MKKNETTKEKVEVASKRKQLSGIVTSDKMKDTCTVIVNRYVKVPKYEKFILRSKKYKADDKGNTKKIGDKATIEECRPISKDKHFRVIA
jgi:small subunit ribosomal protein S17